MQVRKRKVENKLNNLSGKEWIKFTKSWFIHRPPRREKEEVLHPAKFPETLVKEFILFFTKENEYVLDPFAGTGSALVAACQVNRNAIGIEVMEKYKEIAEKRVKNTIENTRAKVSCKVILGDSRNLSKLVGERKFDYCITSPPYWNQLKRNSLRQRERKEIGLDTKYGEKIEDIGNIDSYEDFLLEQKKVFCEVYKVMKEGGYLTIITNNVFYNGRLYPLAFDTLTTLSDIWTPKDEKIWCQDDKPLMPLGIYNAWVGNRHHEYCLIFRKE